MSRKLVIPEDVFTDEVEMHLTTIAEELPRAMDALSKAGIALAELRNARGMRGTRIAELGQAKATQLSGIRADVEVGVLDEIARALREWTDR